MKDQTVRHGDIRRWTVELRPLVVQGNVRVIGEYINVTTYTVRLDGARLTVIVEVECHEGELWGHLSVCGQTPKRPPTWDEMRWCKEHFLGDRKAIQILPPRAEYVNIHPNVLHLWAPLERDPLPDFRMLQADGTPGI